MRKTETIVEFSTKDGIKIEMLKENKLYKILVTNPKHKATQKKVMSSLNKDKTLSEFFNVCNTLTKEEFKPSKPIKKKQDDGK